MYSMYPALHRRLNLSLVAIAVSCMTLATLFSPGLWAAPHPHQGVLTPFTGAPPKIKLSADDEVKLASGKFVRKQVKNKEGSGGRGMVIQDIHASVDTVWGRITDYAAYPRMVDDVKECETYTGKDTKRKDVFYVRFLIGGFGVNLEYYIRHVFRPDLGYMTWTLDYDKKSELDDSVGYWYVIKHPSKPSWTRVYYSIDVRVGGWVPSFIENIVADKGLEKATAWVKRESVKSARKKP